MKNILYIIIVLFIFFGIYIFFESSNNTNSGVHTIDEASDITELSLKAIQENDPSLCNNFKLGFYNVAGYSESEVLRGCNESYNIVVEDRTQENIEFGGEFYNEFSRITYSAPKPWLHNVDRLNRVCSNVYKNFPLSEEDSFFIHICKKDENFIPKRNIGNQRSLTVDETLVTVYDSSNGNRLYSFTKDGKQFDIEYLYKPNLYSEFDEKRILKIISSIKII